MADGWEHGLRRSENFALFAEGAIESRPLIGY
jgi:hypothetical protein